MDPYEMFPVFVERKSRCRAVMLSHANVWQIAQWLSQRMYMPTISWTASGLILEAQRGDASFKASVDDGDMLVLDGYDDVEYVPGQEFRSAWEREDSK